MKLLILTNLALLLGIATYSQTTEDSVKLTINKLFEAMKTSNGEMLKSTFADGAILQTIAKTKAGETEIRTEKIDDFINFVSKAAPGDADERIEFGEIKIDGDLASAWTPYKFFYKGSFSHCGVNSFQLVRTNNDWKIQYIIDTRRKDQCD